ncbi:hypothetical protein B0A50_08767 [Salinomyces thailandicus]|uniref:Uncharacterized protein n=1 Tax=Salinomyces thailandicus TaxID=706561 RepID=A0A4U0TIQ0_9PEZI|nr:hypothetical protein B0A50_08767 [Salinomyces thailandica]
MDFVKNAMGGSSNSNEQNSSSDSSNSTNTGSGGGGFMDKINSAAGGGQASEKNEDYLDKGKKFPPPPPPIFTPASQTRLNSKSVDAVQQYGLGQGSQSNESAVEQAKDEQISDYIRGQYKSVSGKDVPVEDKETKLG